MIDTLKIFRGQGFDPYHNLAIEEQLMEELPENGCILYLWQNQNTVVIGKNQNSWKECRTALLEEEGGLLARRLSGGGAVFHDLGNLNFTFIVSAKDYDVDRQLSVIQEACRQLGLRAEKSGRNDLLAEGRKFSGNAFYKTPKVCYHHGTILISADMEKLGRYLQPSKAKLKAKGVDSVRSRVTNLCELQPSLTVESMKAALEEAFQKVYGCRASLLTEEDLDRDALALLDLRNRSWEWNYGAKLAFDLSMEERFAWGEVRMEIRSSKGLIDSIRVYSDSMDRNLSPAIEGALLGCRLDLASLEAGLDKAPLEEAIRQDLKTMIRKHQI